MPIDQAAHRTVHNYKGGAAELSVILGKKKNVLSNEVNPNISSHKLSIKDAVTIMQKTGDHQMLQMMAHELGYSLLPITDFSGICDSALLDQYALFHEKIGKFAITVRETLDDNIIQRHEIHNLKADAMEMVGVLTELLKRFDGLCEEDDNNENN